MEKISHVWKDYFLDAFSVANQTELVNIVGEALNGQEDGELYAEVAHVESVVWEHGRAEAVKYIENEGFGLRKVVGCESGYVHSSDLSRASLQTVISDLRDMQGKQGAYKRADRKKAKALYPATSPLSVELSERMKLLAEIDAYARSCDPRIREVEITLGGSVANILIVRPDGRVVHDVRPLVRLNVTVTLSDGMRSVSNVAGRGGRYDYSSFFEESVWKGLVGEAVADARLMLIAQNCPSGQMPVVLGPGWTAILLHEAIGHTLEGDFNRMKTSPFSDKMGKVVAHSEITVVDDGTIPGRRGSLTYDDEGMPSQYTTLIENGRVVSYLHDRMSARYFGVAPTGNGRRESFRYQPMPRMTNTYMLQGTSDPQEIIASTKRGIYTKEFSGGQVDIATGNFVFVATLLFPIENGVVLFDTPLRQATLTGTGYDVLTHVDMVGTDMVLDPGIGTCGKNGQSVPVGVGQPTVRLTEGAVVVGGAA